MNSVRIWYKKSGLAIYTSHLDMNRCFTRAVTRAGIPLWYTEGFNPHPYLNFLLPLPLGQTGMREPIDIRIEKDMTKEEIKEKLNAVFPEGIEIVDVTDPVGKVNEVVSSKYVIDMSFDTEGEAEGFAACVSSIMDEGILNAEKRSKRGIKTVNLCEFVNSFEISQTENKIRIETVLATGTEKNLNANLLVDALCSQIAADYASLSIMRTEIYIKNKKIFE